MGHILLPSCLLGPLSVAPVLTTLGLGNLGEVEVLDGCLGAGLTLNQSTALVVWILLGWEVPLGCVRVRVLRTSLHVQ